MKKIKVMTVFGTRPEAIKMCPLILELEKSEKIESIVCSTGQHKEMLEQVTKIFSVAADYDLEIMRPRQNLTNIATAVLEKFAAVLEKAKPDIVLVHGDTSTSFIVALSAFYHQVPVGHVEAGLRTFDKYSPFPEEMNRVLTARIADLHFAPTIRNQENLLAEGVCEHVYITGNTVIDAFKTTIKENYEYSAQALKEMSFENKRTILMTAHRRENLGIPLENICNAVKRIAEEYEDVQIIYPVHLNPAVRETVFAKLSEQENITLTDPIDVEDMHNLMAESYLVLTDSGGLQEEAPSLGVPVLVMRTETERPEAVEAGTVKVLGVEEESIYKEIKKMLTDQTLYETMRKAVNPYGDGRASERIVAILETWGVGR